VTSKESKPLLPKASAGWSSLGDGFHRSNRVVPGGIGSATAVNDRSCVRQCASRVGYPGEATHPAPQHPRMTGMPEHRGRAGDDSLGVR
jgi:hypothetical protein